MLTLFSCVFVNLSTRQSKKNKRLNIIEKEQDRFVSILRSINQLATCQTLAVKQLAAEIVSG